MPRLIVAKLVSNLYSPIPYGGGRTAAALTVSARFLQLYQNDGALLVKIKLLMTLYRTGA
jgi:hypothetical protein